MMLKRLAAVAEAALVLALFLFLRVLLRDSGFGPWQVSMFGVPLVSSCLLFFALPLTFALLTGRDPRAYGLTTTNPGSHWRAAVRATAFVLPATTLFPVIAALGSSPIEWLGSCVVAVGFAIAGLLFARTGSAVVRGAETEPGRNGVPWYFGLLLSGLLC